MITVLGHSTNLDGKLTCAYGSTETSRIVRQIPQNKPHGLAAEPGYHQKDSPWAEFPAGRKPTTITPVKFKEGKSWRP